MLRKLKLAAIAGSSATGIGRLIGSSAWRRKRLLILCYHGISQRDEHLWAPSLFMEQRLFRRRMETLRALRCNVLPLAEGIERLYRGDLPDRSVVVTFDDGWRDFHSLAFPILKELAIPATLYLTTYYANFNRPVFDTLVSYMLWKAEGRPVRLAQDAFASSDTGAMKAIQNYVRREQLTSAQKDDLLANLAGQLRFDFEAMLKQRFMHLMTAAEISEVSRGGVDVELHTHRHRVSVDQSRFNREIEDNRREIHSMTETDPVHFCYPGGNYLPQFEGWLKTLNVSSGTTCVTGMCTKETNRYFLNRVLDSDTISDLEFEAWLTGVGELLPKRQYAPAEGQFLENWERP